MKKPLDRLDVKIVGGLKEACTPWGGTSLLVDLFRRLGMGEAADRGLPAKKTRKGPKHGQMVESFVLLSLPDGECVDDIKRLRDDEGLAGILRAIESGWVHHQIADESYRHQREVERGEWVVVGVNRFATEEAPPPEFHHPDPQTIARLKEKAESVEGEKG